MIPTELLLKRLEDTVVRVFSDGRPAGTGFFVAPGLVVTCAHVISNSQGIVRKLSLQWRGASIEVLKIRRDPIKWDADKGCYPDVALLNCIEMDQPSVWLSTDTQLRDKYFVFGFTGDRSSGDSVTLEDEGEARYNENYVAHLRKCKGGQITAGLSGSPALNLRTSGVSGIVKRTRGDTSDLGGLLTPIGTLLSLFPEIETAQSAYHASNRTWLRLLPFSKRQLPSHNAAPFLAPRLREPFVGRETETAAIIRLLDNSDGILLRSGLGGVGKTALANSVAHQIKNRFPDGVIWLRCSKRQLDDIKGEVVTALDPLNAEADEESGARRATSKYDAALRTHSALLIFDNIDGHDHLEQLAPPYSNCKFIFTMVSGIATELSQLSDFVVKPLSPEHAEMLLDKYLKLGSSTKEDRNDLVYELGGSPLALLVAASTIKACDLTPAEFLTALKGSSSFELFGLFPEQEQLAAAFSVAYNKLIRADHKRTFRLFGAIKKFPAPLYCIAECLGMSELTARLCIMALSAHGLCDYDEKSRQFMVHRLTRRFARKLLTDEDKPEQQRNWSNKLGLHYSKLSLPSGSLHLHYVPGAKFSENALLLGLDAVTYFISGGMLPEAVSVLENLADPLTRLGRYDLLMSAIGDLEGNGAELSPWLRIYRSDLQSKSRDKTVREHWRQELQALSKHTDAKVSSAALICLARWAAYDGRIEEAEKLLNDAKFLKKGLNPLDQKGVAYILNELGRLAVRRAGGLTAARVLHLEALEIQKSEDDEKGKAHTWRRLGSLALHHDNNVKDAKEFFTKSLAVAEKSGSSLIAVHALLEFAECCRREGNYANAAGVLLRANLLAERSCDPFTRAHVLKRLGVLYEKHNMPGDAAAIYDRAASLLLSCGEDREAAEMERAFARAKSKCAALENELGSLAARLDELICREQTTHNAEALEGLRREKKHVAKLCKRLRQSLGLEKGLFRMRTESSRVGELRASD